MFRDRVFIEAASQVSPRALTGYARGLGWQPVPNERRPQIALFHRPDSRLHQIAVPTDPTLADFGEAVAEAVNKLAEFEHRPPQEILDHLLLPPADVLQFRETGPNADTGSLPFEHVVRLINGTKRLLLSVAHSVLVPQSSHPRLSRSEAEAFVDSCRFGQTERGSFVWNVACPLDPSLALPGMQNEPFARRVTNLLTQTLEALAQADDPAHAEDLLDLNRHPGLSANLCEALLLLRPADYRGSLVFSAVWSRALLPSLAERARGVQLPQEAFAVAEVLAPRLRTAPQPRPASFIGFVDALRGQPRGDDPRPSGEVDFTFFDDEQGEIHARGFLAADSYALAGKAHLSSDVVTLRGVLRPLPRVSRIDEISDLEIIDLHDDAQDHATPGAPPSHPPDALPPTSESEEHSIPF